MCGHDYHFTRLHLFASLARHFIFFFSLFMPHFLLSLINLAFWNLLALFCSFMYSLLFCASPCRHAGRCRACGASIDTPPKLFFLSVVGILLRI